MSAPLRSVSRMASFAHALRGIVRLLQTQANARIHLMASTGVVGLGLWLPLTRTDWALLVLAMGGVVARHSTRHWKPWLTWYRPSGTHWPGMPKTLPPVRCCWPPLQQLQWGCWYWCRRW